MSKQPPDICIVADLHPKTAETLFIVQPQFEGGFADFGFTNAATAGHMATYRSTVVGAVQKSQNFRHFFTATNEDTSLRLKTYVIRTN